jgi:regulator of RNase E activity RraB
MPGKVSDRDLLLAIQRELDGVEWNSDTLERIAQMMVSAGYRIRDPRELEDDAC